MRSKKNLKRLGSNRSTQRYFDSVRAINFSITKINDDGLLKIVGIYKGMRAFRHFYGATDEILYKKQVNDLKKDILAEFSSIINEAA